jgi:hypothetical protein
MAVPPARTWAARSAHPCGGPSAAEVEQAYKLNVLHLHLTDDEGWRLEIPGLPELTAVGGPRCHDLEETTCPLPQLGSGPGADREGGGSGYLRRQQMVALLRAARARHIEVVPEIDSPGHARAAAGRVLRPVVRHRDAGPTGTHRARLRRPRRRRRARNTPADPRAGRCAPPPAGAAPGSAGRGRRGGFAGARARGGALGAAADGPPPARRPAGDDGVPAALGRAHRAGGGRRPELGQRGPDSGRSLAGIRRRGAGHGERDFRDPVAGSPLRPSLSTRRRRPRP